MKHPKCTCGHSRERHDDAGMGECNAALPIPAATSCDIQQCPCPWYTPEDRSPQPARVGGSEA